MSNTIIAIKDTGEVESFTSLRAFCDHYPQFRYHAIRWHLAKRDWDYEVNGLRIVKKEMVGRK